MGFIKLVTDYQLIKCKTQWTITYNESLPIHILYKSVGESQLKINTSWVQLNFYWIFYKSISTP